MKELQVIFNRSIDRSENLHHAYMLIGQREALRDSLFSFFEENLGISRIGNPDFSYVDFGMFTIDAARNLAVPQSMKDVAGDRGGNRKIFIIAVDGITEEAQNALLKMFEEPTPGTHFFIIAPQNNFLPTFLSRMQVVRMVDDENNVIEKIPDGLVERLAFVAKLATDISDEKKTKQTAIDVVNTIERHVVETKRGVENCSQALIACEFARHALLSRGAMVKMILENLVLQLSMA